MSTFDPCAFNLQTAPLRSEPLIGNDDFSRYVINEWSKEDAIAHVAKLDKDCSRLMLDSVIKNAGQDTAIEAEVAEYE